MHQNLTILTKEHSIMLHRIREIQSLQHNDYVHSFVPKMILSFGALWDAHEITEDKILKKLNNPIVEQLLLNQHRELKGHWHVLKQAIASQNPELMRVALDTDGAMLFEKFVKHIFQEEIIFKKIKI